MINVSTYERDTSKKEKYRNFSQFSELTGNKTAPSVMSVSNVT